MKTVQARLNWGRWIVECPKPHGLLDSTALEVDPLRDRTFICPACHPKTIAQFVGAVNGKIQAVPDISARKTGRLLAEKAGDVYEIEYPKDMDKIEQTLAVRAKENRNWEPGETLTALKRENKEHGL